MDIILKTQIQYTTTKPSQLASEPSQCEYLIEMYTKTCCPYQCITYDNNKNAMFQCNRNGECAYDVSLGFVRCICDEKFRINSQDDIFCYDSIRHISNTITNN
eukprot:8717_1